MSRETIITRSGFRDRRGTPNLTPGGAPKDVSATDRDGGTEI